MAAPVPISVVFNTSALTVIITWDRSVTNTGAGSLQLKTPQGLQYVDMFVGESGTTKTTHQMALGGASAPNPGTVNIAAGFFVSVDTSTPNAAFNNFGYASQGGRAGGGGGLAGRRFILGV